MDGSIGPEFTNHHRRFLYDLEEPFVNGYEVGIVKYFDMPASWNRRMQRQHGVFLYDTLNYPLVGYADLEAYLGQSEVPGSDEKVMLTKGADSSQSWERNFRTIGANGDHSYASL